MSHSTLIWVPAIFPPFFETLGAPPPACDMSHGKCAGDVLGWASVDRLRVWDSSMTRCPHSGKDWI